MLQDGRGCTYRDIRCGEQRPVSAWFQDLSIRTEKATLSYQKQPRGRELSLVAWGIRKGFPEEAAWRGILRGKSDGDLHDRGR